MNELEKLKEEIEELKYRNKEHVEMLNWLKDNRDWTVNIEHSIEEHFKDIEDEIERRKKEKLDDEEFQKLMNELDLD